MIGAVEEVVGREVELAALVAFLECADELPHALVVDGEAGIGKTTLWRHALDQAERLGYLLLTCKPGRSEAELGFAALQDLVGPVYEDAVASLPTPQRRAIDVALLREDAGDPPLQRAAVATGFLGVLRVLAERAPVLVAMDDLQWLDPSSAAAVEFAIRRLTHERVAVLATRRAGEPRSILGLERAFPPGRLEWLHVGPLSLGAVHRLLNDRLGAVFPRPTLRRMHELSGGNPFFALELGRALERRGGRLGAGESLPVPDQLQELLRDRLATLPDATLEALQFAAALSRPTISLAAGAAEADTAALDPAVEAQVIEVADGRLRFTHPLLASAAYAMLGPGRRHAVHKRLAQIVVEPEERARHLAAAAEGPDEAVASALDGAAALARARGARASAAELLEQAARLTRPELATDRRRRASDAAYLHFESGDTKRGRTMLENLVAELPAGPERARILIRLAVMRSYDDDLHAATDLYLQAEQEAGEDTVLRSEALSSVAAMLFRRREQLRQALDCAQEAVRLARTVPEPALLADGLGQQLLIEATLGLSRARGTLEEMIGLQPATENVRLLSQPKWLAAIVWMWWEELEQAQRAHEELLDRGRRSGEEALLPYVYVLSAQNQCLQGEFSQAWEHAEAGREIAEQVGEATVAGYALALRALADAYRGRLEEARTAGEQALEIARSTRGSPTLFFAASALGLLELSLGRPNEAIAQLEPIVAFARRESLEEPGMTRFLTDHAEALIELSRFEAAEEILDPYEAQAIRLGRRGALGSALRARALLAASRGDFDVALVTIERALSEHEAAPLPFERARTLLAKGAICRRAKRKRDARQALDQGRSEFERLGAQIWARRAEGELARISGRTRTEGELTPTERRVAELVAEGLSTKEVAAALFVAPKTVEGHLSKIYAKLDVRSRAELARTFASVPSDT